VPWGGFFFFRFSAPTFGGAAGRFSLFPLFRPNFRRRRGAVSSFSTFPTQFSAAAWGGFFIFHFSDPIFGGKAGRFLHFSLFRPNFRRQSGAVSSFFPFPTQFSAAPRGGFFFFHFSDPTSGGKAGQLRERRCDEVAASQNAPGGVQGNSDCKMPGLCARRCSALRATPSNTVK
jgi:hypothetical protein